MTRTIRVITAIATVYLCAAFVLWEVNPGEWLAGDRFLCVAAASIADVFAFLSEDMF